MQQEKDHGSNQYEQNPKVSDNAKTSQEQLADMIDSSAGAWDFMELIIPLKK